MPYLPEEFLKGRILSTKVDAYSFGVVLFELITGLPAYDSRRKSALLRDHVIQYCMKHPLDPCKMLKIGYKNKSNLKYIFTLNYFLQLDYKIND